MASNPIIVVSSQPALWLICLKVLLDVILIRCEDPRSTIIQIDLHDAESWCMSWRMAHIDARSNLQEVSMERLPIQIEGYVLGQVHPNIGL